MRNDIKVGDKVAWLSYKNYEGVERTGTVIAIVPKGEGANKHIPETAKKTHVKYDLDVSKIDRILVAVTAGREGQITHYYAPYAGKLEAVEK